MQKYLKCFYPHSDFDECANFVYEQIEYTLLITYQKKTCSHSQGSAGFFKKIQALFKDHFEHSCFVLHIDSEDIYAFLKIMQVNLAGSNILCKYLPYNLTLIIINFN